MKHLLFVLLSLCIVSSCKQIKSISGDVKSLFTQKTPLKYEITNSKITIEALTFSTNDWIQHYIETNNISNSIEPYICEMLESIFNRIEIQSENILKDHKHTVKYIIDRIDKGKTIKRHNDIMLLDKSFKEGSISGKSIEILFNSMIMQRNVASENQVILHTILLENLDTGKIINTDLFILITKEIAQQKAEGKSLKEIRTALHKSLLNCILYNYAIFFKENNLIDQMVN
jgi:hypothetical protein